MSPFASAQNRGAISRSIGTVGALALVVGGLTFAGAPPALATAASGGPGALSHFDLARKDCLGTARNSTSKVWYTVADGVLSDVYYPTVDNTNVETLQYVVTDGKTFTDLQTRDMTYTVKPLDRSGLVCRVTSRDKHNRYSLITDYITDPSRNSVVMHTTFYAKHPGTLALYARYDATVNGNGGGAPGNGGGDDAVIDTSTGSPVPVSLDTKTTTNAANRDYATPVYSALRADRPFLKASSGYVGTASDGLTALDATHTLGTTYSSASNGNVVQTARIDLHHGNSFSLALGFGTTQSAAVFTAGKSAKASFRHLSKRFSNGWRAYDSTLTRPPHIRHLSAAQRASLYRTYYLSANVLKASEDKTFPGAIVASLASPWGQAVSAGDPANTYFGSYREVFARDLYETFTGLVAAGDIG